MTDASLPLPEGVSFEHLTRLAHVLDLLPCGVTLADAGRPGLPLVYVNRRFCDMTGYAPRELLGRRSQFLLGVDIDQHGAVAADLLVKDEKSGQVLMRHYRKDGAGFHNKVTLSPVRNEVGFVTHWLGVHEDITDQLEVMCSLAPVDALTGLPHRGAVLEHIAQLLRVGERQDLPQPFHVLVMDIDNFSAVNAAHGFAVGDACLKEAAERFSVLAPRGAFVGRMGGVQFLCAYQAPEEGASPVEEVGLAFIRALDEPLHTLRSVKLSLSVGIASYPSDGMDTETLVKNAKVAMHHARAAGVGYPLPWVQMLT